MAQVPVYGGPQVRTAALQPVMQREIDVSSGTRALGQALGQIGDLADKTVRRNAEIEVNTADAEITKGWREWDAANRSKYQGQNADNYAPDAEAWWDKVRETYSPKLSPMARAALEQQLARKREQALGSVSTYVSNEKERFADQAGESAALSAIEFGVDTGDTAGAAMQVRKIVAERGARKGWTTEMVQADQQRLLGTLHLSAITTMAERDPAKARAYYDANKGEIPAAAQARVEELLKAEGDNQFATQFAAQQATKPLAEQIAAAGSIADPERREKALTQIRNNHAMVKAVQAEREAEASDEAWQLVGQGRRVPETVLMRMNGRERVQLQDHLRDRAKQAAAGTAPTTDWAAYIDAREKLAAGENVDLRLLTTKIAGPQMEQLLDIQTKTRDPKKMPEVATSEQQIGSFTRQMDLKGERLGQFQAAAYDLFNEHLKAKGKEPTFEERQAILDGLTKDIVIKQREYWFDQTGPAYTAPRDVRNAAVAPKPATPVRISSDDDYNKLPSGARFQAPDGTIRVKP